jgi:UDP-N-acetylmuramoyl-L-alanyl-D-glutamate--2,6-diaminopimelate ligase
MTLAQLLPALAPVLDPRHAIPQQAPALSATCTGVTCDSRAVAAGCVFVAIRGVKADGLSFADAAVAAGAVAVVADRPSPTPPAVLWIVVEDARLALALLACAFVDHPSRQLQVVGVTGTNGKTTTTFLIASVFEAAGTACGLVGTVGYRIGARTREADRTTPEAPDLQRSLREMVEAGCRACAMEVSSHALALDRVAGMEFAGAVFTNLTRDHLDFHGGMDEYFAAKRRLFEMLPPGAPAAINADDPRAASLVALSRRPVTYGITHPADVAPGPLRYAMDGLDFDVRSPQGIVRVRSKLVGRPNVYNILATIAATTALGIPIAAVERGVERLTGVPGRFEVASSPGDDITVVVDYAHTDDALRNLLETTRLVAPRRVITVFGAGGGRDRTKRPLMGMVAARLSDAVVITSDNPRDEEPARIIDEVRRGADAESRQSGAAVSTVVDRREAIAAAIEMAGAGDVVLLAGKGHEKVQVIGDRAVPHDDLALARDALAERARRLKARVG